MRFLIFCILGLSYSAEAMSKSLSASVNHSSQIDAAETTRPRLAEHSLGAGLSYDAENIATFSLSSAYYYTTVGSSISKYPEDHGIAFVRLGASKKVLPTLSALGGTHNVKVRASGDLPLRKDARNDGYRGAFSLGPSLSSNFFNDSLTLRQSLGFNLMLNRYRFSPASGSPNSKNSIAYNAGIDFSIFSSLVLSLDFGVRRTHFSDGFDEISTKNELSLSYEIGNFSVSTSYSNGALQDNPNFGLWFMDRYRKNISLSLEYRF